MHYILVSEHPTLNPSLLAILKQISHGDIPDSSIPETSIIQDFLIWNPFSCTPDKYI